MPDGRFLKSLYIEIISMSYKSCRHKIEQYICKQTDTNVSRKQIKQIPKQQYIYQIKKEIESTDFSMNFGLIFGTR